MEGGRRRRKRGGAMRHAASQRVTRPKNRSQKFRVFPSDTFEGNRRHRAASFSLLTPKAKFDCAYAFTLQLLRDQPYIENELENYLEKKKSGSTTQIKISNWGRLIFVSKREHIRGLRIVQWSQKERRGMLIEPISSELAIHILRLYVISVGCGRPVRCSFNNKTTFLVIFFLIFFLMPVVFSFFLTPSRWRRRGGRGVDLAPQRHAIG